MPFKIAVPNKGRLCNDTLSLLRRAGFRVLAPDSRLFESLDGGKLGVLFVRAQDIPRYVAAGTVDLGVTGTDLVQEQGARVDTLLDLGFGRCQLVVASPREIQPSKIAAGSKVATPFPNLARKYFKKLGKKVEIITVSGATEITPSIGVADVIVDLSQTGSTLREHSLKTIDVILDSTAVLIGNGTSKKSREITDFVGAIESVLSARKRRYLMANVEGGKLDRVKGLLPGLSAPTVMKLPKEGMFAVHAVVEEDHINPLLASLKREGASGILILPIERMIP